MLGRESFLSWSMALGLSALIHFGLAGVLSGQSWTARDRVLIDPVVLPVELIEPTPPPIPREEPRPVPPPARTVLKETPPPPPPVPKETPPPPPVETKPLPPPEPLVQPPVQEAVKRTDPVMEVPAAPPANSPPSASPTPSLPTRGVGPAIGDISKSPTGDAPAPGSPSGAPAVASVPRSSTTSGTGTTSSGTSTRGITQWAHPRGGYQVQPSYPASARRLGIQGTARLKVQVLADGHVGEIVVETSAGHPDLDQAATEAVRQWHFEPARKGSEPVATWVLLPVQFQLK